MKATAQGSAGSIWPRGADEHAAPVAGLRPLEPVAQVVEDLAGGLLWARHR